MKIVFVASEVAPYSKTGGLGDVIGALPCALAKLGEKVFVISPLYAQVKNNARQLGLKLKERADITLTVPIGDFDASVRFVESHLPGSDVTFLFIENDRYYARRGLYTDPADGADYQDNCERFTLLCRGALEGCLALGLQPNVIHCHDWQTGLVPVYLRRTYREEFPETASVFTIHNIAYQGLFWHSDMATTGLPLELFNWKMLEYYGNLSFLKGGLVFSDVLTTVSKQYAKELQTEQYGMGMHGVIKTRVDSLYGARQAYRAALHGQ
jgi:starch synthase